MKDIFAEILAVVSCGIPAPACITLTAMILNNSMGLHVKDLAALTGLHNSEIDHAGMCIRSKRLGTYRTGTITITDEKFIALAQRVREAAQVLSAPAPAPVEVELPKQSESFKQPKKLKLVAGGAQ